MFWLILIIWIIWASSSKKQQKTQDQKFDQGNMYGPAAKLPGSTQPAQPAQPKAGLVPRKKSELVKIILGALSLYGGIDKLTEIVTESAEAAEVMDIIAGLVLLGLGIGALYVGFRNMRLYNTCEGVINKNGNTSIDAIAQALQKPYDTTVSILSAMLRKNYFPNAYIDYPNRQLVMTKNGQPITPVVPYTGAVCPHCHGPIEENALFCKHCGKQLKDNAAVKEAKEQAEAQKKQEEKRKHIRELSELVKEIDEKEFTAKLTELKDMSEKIFQKVEEDPDLAANFRKFINIYMPTIINAVRTYKSVRSADYNIDETIESRKDALDALDMGIGASRTLLGQIYDADQLNVSVELEMLRRMMAADGLVKTEDDFE